jgi:hypothetical protein
MYWRNRNTRCVRTKFRPPSSSYQSIEPKNTHRFSIGEIYRSRYISISIGNLGLTGFGNLDRPYLILRSGHQLTPPRCAIVRAKKANATRTGQWPFKLTDNAFMQMWLQSETPIIDVQNFLSLKRRGVCIGHVITIIPILSRALRMSKNFVKCTYVMYTQDFQIHYRLWKKSKLSSPNSGAVCMYIHTYIYIW